MLSLWEDTADSVWQLNFSGKGLILFHLIQQNDFIQLRKRSVYLIFPMLIFCGFTRAELFYWGIKGD